MANDGGSNVSILLGLPITTTTAVTSNSNPSLFGQQVTFTATVSGSGSTPTGTVTFKDGGTSIGTGELTGGTTATFTPSSSLTLGTHTITAVYGGDTNFSGSTSNTVTQTVQPNTLFVTTFTPTNTGFVVVFNRLLNLGTALAPVLNLYDNSTGTLGPADVALVGSTNGAIRGSLAVDQSNTPHHLHPDRPDRRRTSGG